MAKDTALLMIDVQNMYLSHDGTREALGWPPIWRLKETVSECANLLDDARQKNMPIIYSRTGGSKAGQLGDGPRAHRLMASKRAVLPPQDPDHELWKNQIMDEVAPQSGDFVLDKTRPSFFEYTELEPLLHNLGVRRIIVAGLQTNVCVESTARSGLAHNFEVAVPEDAVSTDGPDLHWSALDAMRVLYVEVAPWRELTEPDAPWDRAYTTPNYGRNPKYWNEEMAISSAAQ